MRKKIQDIATVRSGTYMKEVLEGAVCYLQVSDFNRPEGEFLLPKPTLELNSKIEKHLLLEGDLVFATKGTFNFCSVFDESMSKVVASSSFSVISITKSSIVTPDYLCWVLNREDTLAFFKINALGSSIPSIGKTLIEEYEINIPPISVQQKIVEIARLQKQELKLYEQISNLRSKLIQQQLIQITK